MTEETQYDVFLSHNSQDKPAVEQVAQSLRNRDLEPFLDLWYLRPGLPWPQKLEKVLRTCKAVAVFLGPYGLGGWQAREMYLALERQKQEPHFPVIPVLLPNADPALSFLTLNTWVDLRRGIDDPVGLEILAKAIRGEPPGPELHERIAATLATVCPYRGLRAFREEDAPFFFGRDTFTKRLAGTVEQRSLVMVAGASGSGKSSVVFAGLVPWLRRGRPPEAVWEVAFFTPGDRPYHRLAAALLPLLEPEMTEAERLIEVGKLAPALAEGNVHLRDVAERVLEKQPGTDRLLLVADQFEELYTLTPDESVRRGFVDHLLEAIVYSPIQTVLTLRGDFYGRALSHRPFADTLQDGVVNLGPMTRRELEQVVVGPADNVKLKFEPGLVERILEDVGEEPGNLPLLEFALTELWNRRRGGMLTHEAYKDIGQVQGAIARRAEAEYGRLKPGEQEIARRVFVQLVRPGEGTEDTRRRAGLSEVTPARIDPEAVHRVVKSLADARLVVTGREEISGEETVEVAHEALIRGWGRFQGWMGEDRAFRTWQERIRAAIRAWEEKGRDEGALLRGALLAEAEEWAETRADDMNPLEREFLKASITLRDWETQEAERRRQRELEQTRRLAEERRKRVLWLSGALVLTVIAAIAAVWFGGQAARNAIIAQRERDTAERQSAINYTRELKARALVQMDANAECALALAMEAYDQASAIPEFVRYEFEDVVREALQQTHVQATLTGHTGGVNSVAWSPDGRRLASAGDDHAVRIWDVSTGENIATLTGHTSLVFAVAWSPDGQQLASGYGQGTIRLWDADTGKNIATLTGHIAEVRTVAWSPDGRLLASASDDTTVRLWDVRTGENTATLTGHTDIVHAIAWSPDGRRLASASLDNTIQVWDVNTGKAVATLNSPGGQVFGVAWSPSGQHLASASADGAINTWSVDTEENIATLTGHTAPCWSVAWSPDGQWLASASEDSTIRLWNVETGENTVVLTGHSDIIRSVAWKSDGEQLASVADDGTVRLWRIDAGESVTIWTASAEYLVDITWSPDGQWLASAETSPNGIQLWNTDIGESTGLSTAHSASIQRISWSPDGHRLASASADGTIHLFDVDNGDHLTTLSGHADVVCDAVWSPDGQQLASGSEDDTIRLWDASTGQNIATLTEHTQPVYGVVWSPDGQRLASASIDKTVHLWDANTGESILVLTDHIAPFMSVAWDRDGKQLASGSSNGTIIVWDANTGHPIATLTGHTAAVWDLAWSPDGGQLASASHDGTVRLWDVETGETIATLTGHTGSVRAVTWSPDGRRLASAGMLDHTIIIYYADFQDILPLARAQLERGITPEERTRCLGEP